MLYCTVLYCTVLYCTCFVSLAFKGFDTYLTNHVMARMQHSCKLPLEHLHAIRDHDMLAASLQALDSPLAANNKGKPLSAHVASISRKAKGVRIAQTEGEHFEQKSLVTSLATSVVTMECPMWRTTQQCDHATTWPC